MPVWNGQTLTFVQDRPSDKVWTYNRSNVVMPDDGAPFRYSFSALKDRHNAVEVNWIDPNNGWETATELVEDTQAIARYGRNVTKMDAFGCTSRGQAHRAGLWLIKTELLETQTVDFSVGAEGLRHVPGDVIEICDDDYAGISTGGRVLAVNSQTRTLTLDREITLPSSGTTLISLVDGQMQDGRLYIAGIGAGIENTPAGMQSQVLLAADRIAMINPANGNTKPMFVGQGDQIFMNDVFLKRLTAPTITSGGNPPAFSLTPDGRLTAKNADISGSVNANAGTLNNVTINENCRVLGKLSANQIEGDLVKTVGKAFPRDSRAPERWPSGTITVRVYDDQPFDRQIVIPTVAFRDAKHERENNDIYSSCRLIVKKNGAEIYNRTALDNTLVYTGVIDMPAGRGHMTLEFSVSAWLVNDWYPTASISDLLVVVMKKSTAGISIS